MKTLILVEAKKIAEDAFDADMKKKGKFYKAFNNWLEVQRNINSIKISI
jgi:hypothetical protein